MATTFLGITVIQDNILSGVNLLTVNNPLAFIVEVEYADSKPSRIPVTMSVNGSVVDTYDAIPLRDTSATTRQFVFVANEYVKSFMPPYFDTLITAGTVSEVVPTAIKLKFDAGSFSKTINFRAIDGANQFGTPSGACATDIYNNDYKNWFSQKGGFCYIYFYSTPSVAGSNGTCEILINGITYSVGQVKENRFYRLKVATDWVGSAPFKIMRTLDVEGVPSVPYLFLEGVVFAYDLCQPKILKYYDSNGQYRFLTFTLGSKNNSYKTNGFVSKFVTSLVSDSSDSYVKGKDIEKNLQLNLINFPKEHISIIDDLLASPYVYLHNSDTLVSDELTNWLMVEVTTKSLRIARKGEFITTTIDIKLPKTYSITT